MTIDELVDLCSSSIKATGHIAFSDSVINEMSKEQAATLIERFAMSSLLHLPQHEVAFFDWLKIKDRPAWDDLWMDEPQAPYLISMAFLSEFAENGKEGQFVICDLQMTDNYYFTPEMLLERESVDFVEAVRDRFLSSGSLSPEQALTVEISAGPTDIWHFAYRRGVDLGRAKQAVAALVEDRILVHVPRADHLATYFEAGG